MKELTQKVGKETIRYLDCGEGIPIVFAHGIGKKPEAYLSLIELLSGCSPGHKVIAPEMYGRNYLINQPATIGEYSELTQDFIHSLRLQEYYLVGHSLGGTVCFNLARESKDNICGVVGLSPGLPITNRGLLKSAKHYLGKRIKSPFKSLSFLISNTTPTIFHLLRKPSTWIKIIEDVRSIKPPTFDLTVPAKIFHAEEDELIYLDSNVEAIIRDSGTIIEKLSGLDHNWPISYYELAAKKTREFLMN